MGTTILVLRFLGGAFLLLLNGFFVASEFAMTRIPQLAEEELEGHHGLERASEMSEELEVYLTGCQVGITIASVSLGFVAEPAVSAIVEAGLQAVGYGATGESHTLLSVIVALSLINGLHVIIGEQMPTYLGVERTKTVAKYLIPGLYWWTKGMSPFIRFADWTAKGLLALGGVTISRTWQEAEEELSFADVRAEMDQMLTRSGLSEERREEVLNALEISHQPISEILVPRDEMVMLTAGEPEESLTRIRDHPQHSRFPLFADGSTAPSANESDFVGIVHVTAVLADIDDIRDGDQTLVDVAASPVTLSSDTAVSDAIDRFQEENREMSVVVEEGHVVGLLTAEDAFEAIAGDLEDPFDRDDRIEAS